MITLGACLPVLESRVFAAEPSERVPTTVAVQNRKHTLRHEFGAWVGLLPMDAFTKGVGFTGGYTLHFDDLYAWEVIEYTYSVGVDTRLARELEDLPQPVGPTPFETVRYYGTSNFVFKPIYGKVAVLNRSQVFHETYFVAGAGAGFMTLTQRPVFDVGFGDRVYVGEHLSVRFDARDYLFVHADDLHNEVWIGLGLALGLR